MSKNPRSARSADPILRRSGTSFSCGTAWGELRDWSRERALVAESRPDAAGGSTSPNRGSASDLERLLSWPEFARPDALKFGPAELSEPGEWRAAWLELKSLVRGGIPLVPVLNADGAGGIRAIRGRFRAMIDELAAGNWLLIDTASKDGRRLTDHLATDQLREMVEGAREAGIRLALAGSLRPEDLPILLQLGADLVGVRGAVCQPCERGGPLDPSRLARTVRTVRDTPVNEAMVSSARS
jgi:hypothetical protein